LQDDLHIVDNLDIPTSDPQYLLDLARYRRWGSSVLIVDVNEAPENIATAAAALKTINLIPAVGERLASPPKHPFPAKKYSFPPKKPYFLSKKTLIPPSKTLFSPQKPHFPKNSSIP
ncbi:RM04 protein, partial [Centropus unirufus]|nr:RM04 protein [Centropus unirufus]